MTRITAPLPKQGLTDARGNLTKAGQHWQDKVARSTEFRADSAEAVMAAGATVVQSQGLWATMDGIASSGSGLWRPNLALGLDFELTLTGVSSIGFPEGIPGDLPRPFFSVMVIQNGSGGWALTMSDEFEGEDPIIFDGANDKTLLGFKITSRSPERFTGWAVKGIVAA